MILLYIRRMYRPKNRATRGYEIRRPPDSEEQRQAGTREKLPSSDGSSFQGLGPPKNVWCSAFPAAGRKRSMARPDSDQKIHQKSHRNAGMDKLGAASLFSGEPLLQHVSTRSSTTAELRNAVYNLAFPSPSASSHTPH